MKLTYRDKVILITLLVIFVWVMGVMFFIKPKFEDLDNANKEFDAAVLTLNQKKEEIAADEGLEDRVKEAYKNVTNIANNFYDKMTTDEVSTEIDTLLDDVKIVNDSLSISQYSSTTLAFINGTPTQSVTEIDIIANQEFVNNANGTAETISSENAPKGPVTVPAYTVQFGYTCTLEELQTFLENLRTKDQKSLVVTDCSITDINEERINGNMTLVLMMMPRMKDPLAKNAEAQSQAQNDASSEAAEESAAS